MAKKRWLSLPRWFSPFWGLLFLLTLPVVAQNPARFLMNLGHNRGQMVVTIKGGDQPRILLNASGEEIFQWKAKTPLTLNSYRFIPLPHGEGPALFVTWKHPTKGIRAVILHPIPHLKTGWEVLVRLDMDFPVVPALCPALNVLRIRFLDHPPPDPNPPGQRNLLLAFQDKGCRIRASLAEIWLPPCEEPKASPPISPE